MAPVCAAELLLAADVDELPEPEAVLDELLLEQPATAAAASATTARAKRRMLTGIITRTLPSIVARRK